MRICDSYRWKSSSNNENNDKNDDNNSDDNDNNINNKNKNKIKGLGVILQHVTAIRILQWRIRNLKCQCSVLKIRLTFYKHLSVTIRILEAWCYTCRSINYKKELFVMLVERLTFSKRFKMVIFIMNKNHRALSQLIRIFIEINSDNYVWNFHKV